MASREDGMRSVQLNPGERLVLQLAGHAAAVAGSAVRDLGYPIPTAEQWARISAAIQVECIAAGVLEAARVLVVTREQLADAAELTAYAVVRDVLGPPPMAQ